MPAKKTGDADQLGFRPIWDDITVLAPGGGFLLWLAVVLIHVACWVAATTLGGLAYVEIRDTATAKEHVKFMSLAAPIVYTCVVLAVLVHSLFAPPPKSSRERGPAGDPLPAFLGALLLGVVGGALMVSFNVVATSDLLGNSKAYTLAALAQACVWLGGMMVLSFYVNFTWYGDNYSGSNKYVMPSV